MYRIIAIGAEPYLESVEFSGVSAGDTVALESDSEHNWKLSGRRRVDAIEGGALMIDGAWYREMDGWKARILITPDTVEVKEPYDNEWWESLSGGYVKGQLVTRTVEDADSMLKINEVQWRDLSGDGYMKLRAISNQIRSWHPFARVAKSLGMDVIGRLVDPFYRVAEKSVQGRSFYSQTEQSDAVYAAFELPSLHSFGYGMYDMSYTDRSMYWMLSLALYPDGIVVEHDSKDVIYAIKAIGEDGFLDFASRGMPFDQILGIAREIIENDIDTELVTALIQPKLPDGVEWM